MNRREFFRLLTAGVLTRAAVFLPMSPVRPKTFEYIDDVNPNYAAFRHALKTLCEQGYSEIGWASLDPPTNGYRLASVFMRDNQTVICFRVPWDESLAEQPRWLTVEGLGPLGFVATRLRKARRG